MRHRLILVALIILLAFASLMIYMRSPILVDQDRVHLKVYAGDGVGTILHRADSLGLSINSLVAKTYFRLTGSDKKLAPGRYTISFKDSRHDFLKRLKTGDIDHLWVTIPEGLTVNRTIELLARQLEQPILDFIKLENDEKFLQSLPFAPESLEGYLFPETYRVPYTIKPDEMIRVMVASLRDFMGDSLLVRAEELGFDAHHLLTFASLIEAETADREEMPVISSVFHNRIKRNMLLQCDPTVIYALGGLDRPLYRRDLKFDSPYNTYVYKGLPPGPINSPGKHAILASLYPDDTDYLFFVADVTGEHIFSKTNAQHNKARQEIKARRRAMK